MNQRTLFLAWKDKVNGRQWFPIGRLDAGSRPKYRFRYIGGVRRAQEEAGFPLLMDFPDLERDYRAQELFALFRNRVINPRRPDREEYLRRLDLPTQADPFEVLSTSGGYRVTDAYEVFPKLEKAADGSFKCRFFLHGWRHVNADAKNRLESLMPEEELYVTVELTNPASGLAVQIQTTDYHMIGWAPRYLVGDLAQGDDRAAPRLRSESGAAQPRASSSEAARPHRDAREVGRLRANGGRRLPARGGGLSPRKDAHVARNHKWSRS